MTYIPAPPVKADSCQRVTVKPWLWEIEEYKVWKGLDSTKPQWSGLNIVCDDWCEAQGLLQYIVGNKPSAILRVVKANHQHVTIDMQPGPRDAVIARLVEAIENANDYDQDCECVSCTGLTLAIAAAKGGAA